MEYKEIRIDTLREILLKVYGVYMTVCDRETFMPLETNAPRREALRALIYMDSDIRKTPDGNPFDREKRYFYSNSLGMIWLFNMDGDRAYILGPAFTDNYSVLDILDKLGSRSLSPLLMQEMREFVKQIPIISTIRMQQYGMMLQCCLTGKSPTLDQLVNLNDTSRNVPEQTTAATTSTNYALEKKLWKAVREGNLNYREELESTMANVTAGNISDGKYLRQDKNLAIVQVALACRAAMEGGLSPEIAYPLSDRYIQRIEACVNASQVAEIGVGVLDDYILRVRQVKLRAGVSSQICECCDYISMYPEENPDIHKLAEKYGYTPYYFSKKFKQEVGMSLRDFAAEKKVERAKILLTRSKMSISDVSEALGFNSQSYFGSVFRKLCGMTPSEYQLNHGGNKEANNE